MFGIKTSVRRVLVVHLGRRPCPVCLFGYPSLYFVLNLCVPHRQGLQLSISFGKLPNADTELECKTYFTRSTKRASLSIEDID